ncbi:MAG: helix-turn-helix transcriptional regulator [Mycobacteriaceae bacterium]|nr:helix-turn-helix transcriptional regulator [Mycobacteriaceae bacterium]
MAKHSSVMDDVFAALADPSRRAVVHRLGSGPASVGELAQAAPITLPSFLKHIRVLESSGLIRTVKTGRVRRCELDRDRLGLVDDWLSEQRRVWESRTDRLEQFLTETETKENGDES